MVNGDQNSNIKGSIITFVVSKMIVKSFPSPLDIDIYPMDSELKKPGVKALGKGETKLKKNRTPNRGPRRKIGFHAH
ncbi:hypothetical protein CBW56_00305 [Denitratisoma oestradiolicum]|nr:hypothetical protein CBW56_00305 [Denitratisoma oestradiolicum]